MATYRPKQPFSIAEPCSADWDAMSGDARRRHCAACSRDVHNLAALTPREIESLVQVGADGALPCVRMAQFEDGSLLVAAEARTHMPYGRVAGAVMTAALVTLSAVAGAQQTGAVTLGKPIPPAVYVGQVVGADGKPVPQSIVYLSRMVGGKQEQHQVPVDAAGHFRLAVQPGQWNMFAGAPGGVMSANEAVTLEAGEHQVAKRLELQSVMVTAGVPAMVEPPKPVRQTKAK